MGPRGLLLALLLWQSAWAAAATVKSVAAIAPTVAEVAFYTRPQIKARLRLPDSLQGFAVTAIKPVAGEPGRYAVTVRFKGQAPFGGITAHSAEFWMQRAAIPGHWIVTNK